MSKNISRSIKLFSIQKKKMRLNRVDSSDWGDFFENKETMWNFFFNFRTKKQVMAIFDIDFVFSYPYFVPDVLNAIERSTKNFEIGAFGNRNHVLTSLEFISLKMKNQCLFAVLIICWTVCILAQKVVCIITEEYFFECFMIIHLIR